MRFSDRAVSTIAFTQTGQKLAGSTFSDFMLLRPDLVDIGTMEIHEIKSRRSPVAALEEAIDYAKLLKRSTANRWVLGRTYDPKGKTFYSLSFPCSAEAWLARPGVVFYRIKQSRSQMEVSPRYLETTVTSVAYAAGAGMLAYWSGRLVASAVAKGLI